MFRFGGPSGRRYRLRLETDTFEWRSTRRGEGPVFRDLSWSFEQPDRYPELVAARKPGMLASKGEKELHHAVAAGDPEQIVRVGATYPQHREVAGAIAGLMLLDSQLDRGISLLEEVVAGEGDIGADHFVHKYLPEAGLTVDVAAGVLVHLPLQRNAIVLLLAELHQARGEVTRATQLLENAEPTSHVRLSLVELLYEAHEYARVMDLTTGVNNDDDVTALMLAYRGRALAELGRLDEAIVVLARALEYPNRAAAIKAIALVGRGMVYRARGEEVLAENDFSQALVELPDDAEARQHIEELIRDDGDLH